MKSPTRRLFAMLLVAGLLVEPVLQSPRSVSAANAAVAVQRLKPFTLDSIAQTAFALEAAPRSAFFQSIAVDPRDGTRYKVVDYSGHGKGKCHTPGDLLVRRLAGGVEPRTVSEMCLKGTFSHGQSIGIERPAGGSSVYLWVATMTGVARVRWAGSKPDAKIQAKVAIKDYLGGSSFGFIKGKNPGGLVMTDAKNGLLIVGSERTVTTHDGKKSFGSRFVAFKMADAVAKRLSTPVYTVEVPHIRHLVDVNEKASRKTQRAKVPFQGATIYGGYVYMLYGCGNGNAFKIGTATVHASKSLLALERWSFNVVADGRVKAAEQDVNKDPSNIRSYLIYREPEGLLVVNPLSSSPRLGVGIAARKEKRQEVSAYVATLPMK